MRILAALLLCTSLQAANWIVLRTPGLELFTDASEKTARQALDRLSQIRRLLPDAEAEPVPLRMILFSSDKDYRALAPSPTSGGFYQSGLERDYIVLSGSGELSRTVVHEYVHFALNARSGQRPAWIEEGLAEFYSNASITSNGAKLGSPIKEHLELLNRNLWLTAEQMEAPKHDPMFYAQAWALVHMFRHQPAFPEKLSAEDFVDLQRYLKNLKADQVPPPPSISAPPVTIELVSPLNVLLMRGDVALRTQHTELAAGFFEQAAREYSNSSSAAAGLGALASAKGDEAAAMSHLRHALALNGRDSTALFELGLLEHDDEALRKAVAIDPNLGEAHLLLGIHATDDGDLPGALRHLEQAVRLMPRKSYAWYSLAFAQVKRADTVAARESLQRALHTASTPEQRAMAETLLASLDVN